ncbi:peptidoglycan bridge formation glycyltransferase FemA/FemB family protein [Candidatus Njordibacter sp. Uisw_039]|uniref:lipid II:glycine glycyltransferase FemX n=1 Tax=Candidatus Njordibacter sp. Uisw_039 TaxID=3230972 RepID=UPI003D53C860
MLISSKKSIKERTKVWHVRQVSKSEWISFWQRCTHNNLLQSWEYGAAKEQSSGWTPKRLVVFNENNLPIALVQVLTRSLTFLGSIARINRGPLLLNGSVNEDVQLKIDTLHVLMSEARRQRWWIVQIAPEISDSECVRLGLKDLGFRKQGNPAWASSLIDLSLSINELHSKLNRRWKRALLKAPKLGVIVKNLELTDARLAHVLKSYGDLQKRNKFVGINSKLIEEMSKKKSVNWDFNLFVAELVCEEAPNKEVGYRVTVRSGNTVLDFMVSTNEKGREVEANSALYWHAIVQAKQNGCRWFDVGGLSEATPKGIAVFKQGLNATPYQLVGEWRKWL